MARLRESLRSLWRSQWVHVWLLPAMVFVLAFVPRAQYDVSRPEQWYERSIRFWDALLAGDLEGTYQQYHPGVTTMWLSGGAMRLFAGLNGLPSSQLLGSDLTRTGVIDSAVGFGVLPLALAVALCTALSYHLLRRIAGRAVAVTGSLLLALDPFYLEHGKELHVNGLLTAFMFTSVLFLFSHLKRPKRSHLVLSGVFAGLSMLTKTPAVFLVPFAILAVLFRALVISLGEGAPTQGWVREWARRSWTALRELLLWGLVSALVFVALWPALWVEPLDVFGHILESLFYHTGSPLRNPQFFNGQVTLEDPGAAFYLATVAWKLTLVTLPMAALTLVAGLLRPRRWEYGWIVNLLTAFVVFFTVPMSLAEYKLTPYILPVFPALDTLAAFGLVLLAQALSRLDRRRAQIWLPAAVVCVVLGMQAAVALRHHPYYGAHHNMLLGGSRQASRVLPLQDHGEGLDLAAQYLNTMPGAATSRAAVDRRGLDLFRRIFVGVASKEERDPSATYRIYTVNGVLRGVGREEWREQRAADLQTDPLWTVSFDGVPYVWIYGAPAPQPAAGGPEKEIGVRLGDHIWLERVRISSNTARAGDTLTLVPVWVSDGRVSQSYSVFCHLLSSERLLVAQRDGMPIDGKRPTATWGAGEVIEDRCDIALDPGLPPADYELSLGMYDLESFERLPAYDAGGVRLSEDRIVIGTVRVVVAAASSD